MRTLVLVFCLLSGIGAVMQCSPASKSDYDAKFTTFNEFRAWMDENGHTIESVGPRPIVQMVQAVDGRKKVIFDGKRWECYLFSDQIAWEGIDDTMKSHGLHRTFVAFNAKCFSRQ